MTNRFERYAREDGRPANRFERYAQPESQRMGWGEAALSGAADAITFGWGDELMGVIGGEEARDRSRAHQERARADQSGAFLAGQIGGSFVGGGGIGAGARLAGRAIPALGRAAASAAGRMGPMSRIAAGAGMGAAGGALYGAGDAVDGMRGEGAMTGAMWGAPFGAGGQGVAEVGGRLFGAAGRALSPEARAAHMVGGMQQRFGQTPQNLAQELQNAPAGAMVMDVIPGGPGIVSGAGARPSAEREAMRQALDARNNAATQSAIDDIWSGLGGGGRKSASANIEEMSRQQRTQAAPLYEAALSKPLNAARAQELLGPIVERNPRLFQLAEQRAQAIALSETGQAFTPANPRYWHYLKQGADEAFEALRNPMAGQGGLGPAERRAYARALHGFRFQLGRVLGPEYQQADAIWGGLARQQNAVRLGIDAIDTKADDMALGEVMQAMRRMSPGELAAMRVGALTKMTDMLENAATGTGRADPVRTLIRSQGQRRALQTLFGGERAFDGVMRRLDQHRQLFRNSVETGIGVNSHTADRLLAYQSQVARTNPTGGGIKDMIVRTLTGDAADQYDEAVSNQILQMMRTPARDAAQEITSAGGVERWARGRGLLSRAAKEQQRLATDRQRRALEAITTGLYAPAVGDGAMGYGGL